jgi:hypothetical protein
MNITRSTVTGLFVGPAIVVGALTGASQAAHSAAPARQVVQAQQDHDHGWGWDHRDPRWDPRWSNRHDHRWDHRYDPRWGYHRYDPRWGYHHWDHR